MAGSIHERKIGDELKRLLEELRVAVPGVQILLGFLLTVPFDTRFEKVSSLGLALYVCALGSAAVTSILLFTPTVYHRLHFRADLHDEESMLTIFNRLALAGMTFLACGLSTGLAFVAELIFGRGAAAASGVACALLCAACWYVLPIVRRHTEHPTHNAPRRRHAEPDEAAAHR